MKERLKIFKDPRIKHGSIATAITVFFIIFAIALNVLAGILTNKYDWNFDLTKTQVFNITDESKNYIKTLNKDVEIIVLNDEDTFVSGGDYYKQANSVIKKYEQNSDKISVKYVVLKDSPSFASSFPEDELQDNSIIVKSGDKHTVLNAYDLFNVQYSYYGNSVSSSQAEQAMTSAILNVTSDTKPKISIIEGFSEADSYAFEELLKKNSFDVVKTKILTENIDEDSKVVVIYGPTRDYDNEALAKVKSYLGKDKTTVFYVLNAEQASLPNLEAFLSDWSIKIGSGIVFESNTNNLLSTSSPFYAVNEYVDTKYTENLKDSTIPVTVPYSKPIEILDEERVSVLLEFSETSGIVPQNADANWKPSESDMKANIPSAVLSTITNQDTAVTSNVAVIGSVAAFDSALLSRSSLNNSAYFVNMFNKLSDRDDAIIIQSKSIGGQELGINANQSIILGIVFTIGLPLLVIAFGVLVWIKRRRL